MRIFAVIPPLALVLTGHKLQKTWLTVAYIKRLIFSCNKKSGDRLLLCELCNLCMLTSMPLCFSRTFFHACDFMATDGCCRSKHHALIQGKKKDGGVMPYMRIFTREIKISLDTLSRFLLMSLVRTAIWPLLRNLGRQVFDWVHLFMNSTNIYCVPNMCQILF